MDISLFEGINYFVFLYPLYMSLVWIIGGLIFYIRREKGRQKAPELEHYPLFSIIIPANNEEDHIEGVIGHLSKVNYPKYEVIVVNDGSTDKTEKILNDLVKKYPQWLRVVHLTPNMGKATALNTGTLLSQGEFVLAIDADAFLDPDALRWIAWHFVKFPRVGAVTGNPRVANRTTLLAKIQVCEYASIIGLIKRTQRLLGKVLTVSGVIAAFRKSALCDVGFLATDMVTEDIDATWKLEKRFWDIRFEPRAVCWVLVPETIRGLWRQRLRWAQGGVEVLKKHLDIWRDWRQRRLWPIYIEYLVSAAWAYGLLTLIVFWGIVTLLHWTIGKHIGITPTIPLNPAVPKWEGAILAFTCVIQFLVSAFIDHKYEKGVLKYYFWVIWYPFFYWFISAVTVVVAAPKALIKKPGTRAIWRSPDRGLRDMRKQKRYDI